jgi:hypothetical protein
VPWAGSIWRLASLNGGERPKHLTLDIDGPPIEVYGHQGGSAFHGHVGARIYSPLIAAALDYERQLETDRIRL